MSNICNVKTAVGGKVNEWVSDAVAQLIAAGAEYRKMLYAFDDFRDFLLRAGVPLIDDVGNVWWLEQTDYELGLALYRSAGPLHEHLRICQSGIGDLFATRTPSNSGDNDFFLRYKLTMPDGLIAGRTPSQT